MSDSLFPDVIKSASDAVQHNLPTTAEQTDGALSTVIGFFNNVVLYPVKKANLSFKYKLESFEADLKEKTMDIPEENLQIPPTMIAGPLLEALRYTYDEDELRDMYENLLASAMDSRTVEKAHPYIIFRYARHTVFHPAEFFKDIPVIFILAEIARERLKVIFTT